MFGECYQPCALSLLLASDLASSRQFANWESKGLRPADAASLSGIELLGPLAKSLWCVAQWKATEIHPVSLLMEKRFGD
jgi:hypothetical protein